MISRRALLGTGAATAIGAAALGGAALAHRLDEVARAVGIAPHPEPDPADDRLLAAAAADQNAVLALVEATAAAHPRLRLDRYVDISTQHVTSLGVTDHVPTAPTPPAEARRAARALSRAYARASRARADDSETAFSPALVRVLASMSASLAQCAEAIEELR